MSNQNRFWVKKAEEVIGSGFSFVDKRGSYYSCKWCWGVKGTLEEIDAKLTAANIPHTKPYVPNPSASYSGIRIAVPVFSGDVKKEVK